MLESVAITANAAHLTIKDWAAQNFERLGELLGKHPAAFLGALNTRTSLYEEREDYDEALKFYNGVLAGQGKLLGPDRDLTLTVFGTFSPHNSKQKPFNKSFKLFK